MIHVMRETDCKRLTLRPDRLCAAFLQMRFISHRPIQQPQRIQSIECKIGNNPFRGKITGKAVCFITALEKMIKINIINVFERNNTRLLDHSFRI